MKIKTILLGLLLGVSSVFAQVPTNGLVGYWPFNGNANDASGNGNNGTVNGATLTTDRFGNVNSAYEFKLGNKTNFIDLGNFLNQNKYSISVWFQQYNKTNDFNVLLSNYSQTKGFEIRPDAFVATNGTGWSQIVNKTNLETFKWHNIVTTFNGSVAKLYINNIYIDSLKTIIPLPINNLLIGNRPNDQNYVFNFEGIIDDIRIYNSALTKSEITALFNENICPPTVNITPLPSTTYLNAPAITLVGTPTGGKFTGKGVAGNTFTPAIAGMGKKNIQYSFSNCATSANTSTIVYDTLCVNKIAVTDTLIISRVTGFNDLSLAFGTVKIFPNPTSDVLNIAVSNPSPNYTIKITNSTSQTLFTTQLTTSSYQLNLSTLGAKGLYFIQILDNTNKVLETKKLVLE
jgi:hypothetical protein